MTINSVIFNAEKNQLAVGLITFLFSLLTMYQSTFSNTLSPVRTKLVWLQTVSHVLFYSKIQLAVIMIA